MISLQQSLQKDDKKSKTLKCSLSYQTSRDISPNSISPQSITPGNQSIRISTTTSKDFLSNIIKKSLPFPNFNFNIESKAPNEDFLSVKSKSSSPELDENKLKEVQINSNDKCNDIINKVNGGSKLQLDFLQANPPNRTKVLKEILLKMDLFRLNPPNMNKMIQYFTTKVELSKGLFYNFIKETDNLKLKVLIQILYEELDNLIKIEDAMYSTTQKQIDIYESKLQEKIILNNKFATDQLEIEVMHNKLNKKSHDSHIKLTKYQSILDQVRIILSALLEELKAPQSKNASYNKPTSLKMLNSLVLMLQNLDDPENSESKTLEPEKLQILEDLKTMSSSFFNGNLKNENIDWPMIVKKYQQIIAELEKKNKLVENDRSQLQASMAQLHKINKENESIMNNNKVLIDEVKKAQIEKQKSEDEYNNLKQTLHNAREDFTKLSNQFNVLLIDKDTQINKIKMENINLTNKIDSLSMNIMERLDKHKKVIKEIEEDLRYIKSIYWI